MSNKNSIPPYPNASIYSTILFKLYIFELKLIPNEKSIA